MNNNHFIRSFINQVKFNLIGYQAYYEDESNKFYTNLEDIENSIESNPLINVKQVGTLKK